MLKNLGTNQSISKEENKKLLHFLVFSSQGITRQKLAEMSGLTAAAVSLITSELIEEGVIEEFSASAEELGTRSASARRGRKSKLLRGKDEYAYFLGCNIEPEKIRLCLMNLGGEILDTAEKSISSMQYDSVRAESDQLIRLFLSRLSAPLHAKLAGIGLSLPCLLDSTRAEILDSRYDWAGRNWAAELAAITGLPVTLINSVKGRALQHSLFNPLVRNKSFLYFYAAYGLGAQYVTFDSKVKLLLPGEGEVGHTLVDPAGPRCPSCGKRGCLEAYASEPVLLEKMRGLGSVPPEALRSFTDLMKYLASDQAAEEAWTIYADAVAKIAVTAANLYNFISPSIIFFSGKVFASERGRELLAEKIETYAYKFKKDKTQICFPDETKESGAMGAASAALMAQFLRQEVSGV